MGIVETAMHRAVARPCSSCGVSSSVMVAMGESGLPGQAGLGLSMSSGR